ncbi:MAG: hypothetical protein JSS66_07215 [Armatimonadetes bacterium]|nr:hypothetical protein [Armatimonadota bacterium]
MELTPEQERKVTHAHFIGTPQQWMSKQTAKELAQFARDNDPNLAEASVKRLHIGEVDAFRNVVELKTKGGSSWLLTTPPEYSYYRNHNRPAQTEEQASINDMCRRLAQRRPSTQGFKAHKRLS